MKTNLLLLGAASTLALAAPATAAKAPTYKTGLYKGQLTQTLGGQLKTPVKFPFKVTLTKKPTGLKVTRLDYRAAYICGDGKPHIFSGGGTGTISVGPRGGFTIRSGGLTVKGKFTKKGTASGTLREVFESDDFGECGTFEAAPWTAKR